MGQIITKCVANGVLLSTSLWCLKKCDKGYRNVRTCFRLYFMISALTLVNMFCQNATLKKLEKVTWVWSYSLGLPLIATDLSCMSPHIPDISPFHVIVPIYTALVYHTFPHKLDTWFLAVSHTISILFMVANTIFRGVTGLILSFIHLFCMFRSDVGGDPQVVWALFMSCSNLLVLDLIKFEY